MKIKTSGSTCEMEISSIVGERENSLAVMVGDISGKRRGSCTAILSRDQVEILWQALDRFLLTGHVPEDAP